MAWSSTTSNDVSSNVDMGGYTATFTLRTGFQYQAYADRVDFRFYCATACSSANVWGFGVNNDAWGQGVGTGTASGVITDGNWVADTGWKTVTVKKTHSVQTVTFSSHSYGGTVNGYGPSPHNIWGSVTTTVNKLASYAVSYDANGGTGAPSSQTKWYGETLTLSSTRPTRTGYTFLGWTTAKDGAVAAQPGGSYAANAAVTYYAKWQLVTYSVTLDGNGGSWSGTKTKGYAKSYGQALALPNAANSPTRTNYKLLGWAASASATSAAYAIGGSYTANAAATLYAVWQLDYVKAVIGGLKAYRVDANGEADDEGTSCKVEFRWTSATLGGAEYTAGRKLTIKVGDNAAETVAASPGASAVSFVSANAVGKEQAYAVTVTASDDRGSVSITATVPFAYYTMDFKAGGKGVALGKASTEDGLDVNMPVKMRSTLDVGGNLNVAANLDTAGWLQSATSVYAKENLVFGNGRTLQNVALLGRTPNRKGTVLTVHGGANADGDAVVMGDGGMVVVGAGESGEALYSQLIAAGKKPGTEELYLAADSKVYVANECDTIAKRDVFSLATEKYQISGDSIFLLKFGKVVYLKFHGITHGSTVKSAGKLKWTVPAGWRPCVQECIVPIMTYSSKNGRIAVHTDGTMYWWADSGLDSNYALHGNATWIIT